MRSGQTDPKRVFLWQSLLIILPVAALAVLGVISLSKDKLLVQSEAAERAQAIAETLLREYWGSLTNHQASQPPPPGFSTDQEGWLKAPPQWTRVPDPSPLHDSGLTASQRALWDAASQGDSKPPEEHALLWRRVIEGNLPSRHQALAQYSLAMTLANANRVQEAIDTLQTLVREHQKVLTESGLPLTLLAQIKMLEFGKRAETTARSEADSSGTQALLESVCKDLVERPSPLSPLLLSRVSQSADSEEEKRSVADWTERWQRDEASRALYEAFRSQVHGPTVLLTLKGQESAKGDALTSAGPASPRFPAVLWLQAADEAEGKWVAVQQPADSGRFEFACYRERELGAELRQSIEKLPGFPPYFGAAADVAGQRVKEGAPDLHLWWEKPYMTRGGGGFRRDYEERLASTVLGSATLGREGVDTVRVSVYLTSPGGLFRQQRTRTFWFGLLVGCAALAAAAGLVAAYRTFRRQLQLSEMKSNFVSSVSHELRAPIASVRLMAESLEYGRVQEPAKQREYFRFIAQECRRLSSLIENVLDFSRIERGRKQYDLQPTDLVALVKSTFELMRTYAKERGIELAVQLPGVPQLEATADGKAIQQAIVNLVDNALKHSPPGGEVTLGLEHGGRPETSDTRAQTVASIWVEDYGEGIPPEEHARIFERFYRSGSELRRRTQGVGIGLSIVKHIAEAHRGVVRLRSAPGQGSRFTIELPL